MSSLVEIALIFGRLGATAFGGPLAHIALMRTEFVEKRGWVSEREFLDLNGAVNLIPGPNSTELAMHLGYRRAGNAGLFVAGCCFILPAFFLVLLLAALYQKYGSLPVSSAILKGLSPVVLAVVVGAFWKFLPTALQTRRAQIVAAIAAVALFAGVSEVAVIFGAAALGLVLAGVRPKASLAVLALPMVPVAGGQIFWVFLQIGCLVYGSGYVLLAYLRSELVERLGWTTDQVLIDAIAVGQMTPGPVFTAATFLGYQIGGVSGAVAATLGIFGPSFVFVAILARFLDSLSQHAGARIFLDCVVAASFASMALVTEKLARAALFSPAGLDWESALLFAVCSAFLMGTKINSAWLLCGGAVAGVARYLTLG